MSNNGWQAAARRRELTLIVLKAERARIIGGPLRTGTAVVAELRPGDAPPFQVCFASVDRLREFVADMQPRSLMAKCAPGEHAADFSAWPSIWRKACRAG